MFGRLFNGLVVLFWLLAMSWLLAEKVIPPLLGGDPPDYQSALAEAEEERPTDAWRIRLQQQSVGFAATRIVPRSNGVDTHSFVEFEDLPLDSLLSDLLGPLSFMMKPLTQQTSGLKVDLLLATRMRFNEQKQLQGFDTTLDLGEIRDFLKIRGSLRSDGQLDFVAHLPNQGVDSPEVFSHRIKLPPEVLVESSLTPRTELRDLQVGQTWTIPVFRAFPPNSPVQILQANVEKHDVIIWETGEVEAMLVTYRTDAGSGLNATREPVSREWVKDGQVLRQEINFSGLNITFERQLPQAIDNRDERLDQLRDRLWPG